MFKSDVFFLSLIISGLAMGWIGCALKAEAREKAIWKQAVSCGCAEQIVENDQIVFKWKIPASATAELK